VKHIMERVINELTDHKAEADLIFSTAKTFKLSAQKGAISEYKVTSSQILGVRTIKDGRVGISYTESLDDESVALLIKQSLQNALTNEPNPHERILELSGHGQDEMIYPEKEVDVSIKSQKILELEASPKKLDSRVVAVPYNGYTEGEYSNYYMSSRGRTVSYKDKMYSIYCSALLDDSGKKANFSDVHSAHTFQELQWDKVVKTSLDTAKDILLEKSLPTGKYAVKFNTDCLKDLIECFSNFYSAKSALDKVNPWSEKLGQEVLSKNLTITDHPLYEGSFRISRFDSEGVERKPLTLVENGVLKNFYHNSATASYFKTTTTGHASRGASGPLGVSGTQMMITGKTSVEAPKKYLEVIQMDGLYSGANRVTGNFSVAVKGYVWENGQRTMTFGNITLSGNLIEILNRVQILETNLESSTDLSFFSVPLLFEGMSIAGA
jgi:PmbA protein